MKAIHYIGCLLAALSCYSCSEYLDIKPYGRTIPKTAEEFSALIHNHLNNIDIGNDALLIGNISSTAMWDTGCGDDFENCLTSAAGSTLPIYLGEAAYSVSRGYDYRDLYAIIRDCNLAIHEMKEDGTEEANLTRGTAYALRGTAYYQLMRLYCEAPEAGKFDSQQGVPLVTSFDMEAKPLRSTLQETIGQIESDLKEAIGYHISNPLFRFTEDVCKGYLARLYFWSEQWGQALPLAQELLRSHPLVEGEAYTHMIATSTELTGNQLIKSYQLMAKDAASDEQLLLAPLQYRPVSKRLISQFPSDERERDIRYKLWFTAKRINTKPVFCGMRAAEFALMEAECQYHLGREAEALKAINNFRRHRISDYRDLTMDSLPPVPSLEIIRQDATGKAVTPLLGLILSERRKELYLESDRFFELKRNGTPEYWTAYNGRKYTTQVHMYTFPIPAKDLLIVDGLKQNPGYTERVSY